MIRCNVVVVGFCLFVFNWKRPFCLLYGDWIRGLSWWVQVDQVGEVAVFEVRAVQDSGTGGEGRRLM